MARMRSAVLAALAMCMAPALAPAQQRDAAGDTVAAAALFDEGRAAAAAEDWARACAKFQESMRLGPAPGTLLNLAYCNDKLGRIATAWQLYRQVADQLPSTDERVAPALARLKELDPRLPRLTITLAPGAPPDLVVRRDGVVMGAPSLGIALPLDPGPHVVLVSAPGRPDRRYDVGLDEGALRELAVQPGEPVGPPAPVLIPVPLAERPRVAPAPSSRGALRTGAWIGLGVGVAGIGAGAVLGALALDRKATMEDEGHCNAAVQCDSIGLDAASEGETFATASTIGFVVGGVALGAGLVLLIVSRPRSTARVGAPMTRGISF